MDPLDDSIVNAKLTHLKQMHADTDLVSTYVVCERLSVMQRQARLPEIFDQIAQFTPKLEFGFRMPPPPEI